MISGNKNGMKIFSSIVAIIPSPRPATLRAPTVVTIPGRLNSRRTWEYNHVTKELLHVQKYLDVITARTTRLKTWFDELYNANELARKICYQLEIIEAQVINICINTKFTVKAIEILYCMIREFYVEVDCL